MYTIKQASTRSGVPVALLRAWERRYGVVSPARTAARYRLYDEAAVDRLRTMRALVDGGWAPAQAAKAVIAGEVPAPPTTQAPSVGSSGRGLSTGQAGASAHEVRSSEASASPATEQAASMDIPDLVSAAARFDAAGIEGALDAILARGSYEAVVDELLLPAVAALGTAWVAGDLDVAAEHLASEAVMRRLATLFDLASAPGVGRSVVVGLPPGNLHEIGVLAFAIALRRRGTDVLYLGPNVPVSSWVHALETTGAAAAVIGVARPTDIRGAREVAEALLAARPGLLVAIGGPVADRAADGLGRSLPGRVVAAARDLSAALAG